MSVDIIDLEVADYETAEQALTDWSILNEPQVADIAEAISWRFAEDYPNLFTQEDAHQEVRLILAERAVTARQVLADGTGLLYRWLTQRMRDKFLTSERRLSNAVSIDELDGVELGRPGVRTEFPAYDLDANEEQDEKPKPAPVAWERQPKTKVPALYDRRLVEAMLPYVFDDSIVWGMKVDTAPDPDMPRGSKDPSKGWNSFAHLVDVRRAWALAGLSDDQRRAVFLHYALDYTEEEAATQLGAPRSTVEYRIERGVGLLAAWLNGSTYVDGYDQLEDEQ